MTETVVCDSTRGNDFYFGGPTYGGHCAERWCCLRAEAVARAERARDERRDRRERSEAAGEGASEASVWSYT